MSLSQISPGCCQREAAAAWLGKRPGVTALGLARGAGCSHVLTHHTAGSFSAPSCRVCVVSWRPWPPPWCAQPRHSLSPAEGTRHGDALPQLSTGCSHVESRTAIWAGTIGAGWVISEVIS